MSKEVVQRPHPRGEPGIRASADEIRRRTLENFKDPHVKEWIGPLIQRNAGHNAPPSKLYNAILKDVRARAVAMDDPKDTEMMASVPSTLCLAGENSEEHYCFRSGDCDDLLIAFMAGCLCANLDVAMIVQYFDTSVHVLAGAKTEDGWQRADIRYQDQVGTAYQPKSEKWIDVMTGEQLCNGSPTCKPDGTVSTQAFLNARPNGDFVGVGAAEADPATQIVEAWGEPLKTVTLELQAAVARANSAAQQLSMARQAVLGDGSPTIQEKQTLDTLNSVTQQLTTWAEDALNGKRSVAWSASANDLAIEGQSSDPYFLRADSAGTIRAYDPKTGAEIGGGQLGVAPAVVGLVVVGALATVAVTYGVYLIAKKTAEAYEVHEQQQTYRTLSDNTTKLIQSGKVTPDQAKDMIDTLGKIKPTTPQTQVEQKQGTFLSNLQGTVKWVVIGLGVAVVAGGGFWAYGQWKAAHGVKRLAA